MTGRMIRQETDASIETDHIMPTIDLGDEVDYTEHRQLVSDVGRVNIWLNDGGRIKVNDVTAIRRDGVLIWRRSPAAPALPPAPKKQWEEFSTGSAVFPPVAVLTPDDLDKPRSIEDALARVRSLVKSEAGHIAYLDDELNNLIGVVWVRAIRFAREALAALPVSEEL